MKKTGKKSMLKKQLLVILVLILVIITATAALFIYSRTAKTTNDDIAAIISTKTMPAAERYSFDASSLKMEISIDKSDLWWLIKEADKEDIMGQIANDLESNGFTLQSYGLDITGEGVLISVELTYGDFLRLPLKLLTDTSLNNGTLTISPSSVYLGKIRLPLEKFPLNRLASGFGMNPGFSFDDYKYDIAMSDWDLMSMLTNIYFKDNHMIMVYNLDDSLFSHSVSAFGDNLSWYADECTDCIEVLREYRKEGAIGERFTRLVESFSSNPDNLSGFIAQTLAVSTKPVSKAYLDKNELWLVRFMPEINDKCVSDLNASLYNLCSERSSLFHSLLDTLQASYNSRKFGIDERGFTYNNKPFDLKSYLGDGWDQYSGWLDASSFRPVLIGTINAYDVKTPLLQKITDSRGYIDYVDTLDEKYPIGFIVKMKDGTPLLKYYSVSLVEDGKTKIIDKTVVLDSAQYESMRNNPLVPVWRD
jgi:hypothetical protein